MVLKGILLVCHFAHWANTLVLPLMTFPPDTGLSFKAMGLFPSLRMICGALSLIFPAPDLPPVIRPPVQLGFVSRGLVADSPEHYVVGKDCTTCATVQ